MTDKESIDQPSNVETSEAPADTTPADSGQSVPEKIEPTHAQRVKDLLVSDLDIRRLIELDACTRCGECLTWCPVYDQDNKESIIPRAKVTDFLKIIRAQQGLAGRIMKSDKAPEAFRALIRSVFRYKDPTEAEVREFVKNLYECSTCGQCHVVCPAHIDTVNLWEDIRRIIVKADYGPLEQQKALVKSVKSYDNPWQQPRAGRTKWARRAKKDNLITDLPREIKKTSGKVLLFLGCTAAYDINVKQVAVSTINILEALDVDYGVFGKDEKCCGSVMLRMGDPEFQRIAADNIEMFHEAGFQTLITSCAGCFKTIKEDYPRIGDLNFEVLHTVEFLRRLYEEGKLTFKYPVEQKVTYHDPCHLGRAAGVFDDPRFIMEAIPGLELIEMPRNREYSRCCGAGGGLKAGYPDIQNKMAQRRVQEAQETGAEALVSACPFCYQGLQIGISALDSPLVMRDISYLVERALIDPAKQEKKGEQTRRVRKRREKPARKAESKEALETDSEDKPPEKEDDP
ncbi:MAG: (Fe-S)-binding protein [Deltaproteobacteria bacterium]|nr:(Fe-S)-binding protein [Deltaproteobacteria bacterium]